MWFGADLLLHSRALPPRSPVWDINTAAVAGRALTFSRCREVMLCRQISPSRKIHQGEGENTALANSGILPVALGSAGVCSSRPGSPGGRVAAAETWGRWVRKRLVQQRRNPCGMGWREREGESREGRPAGSLPRQAEGLPLPAPSLPRTG